MFLSSAEFDVPTRPHARYAKLQARRHVKRGTPCHPNHFFPISGARNPLAMRQRASHLRRIL